MSWFRDKTDVTGRSGVVTVLDVGSSKVCCIVARLEPLEGEHKLLRGRTHSVNVIGIGHHQSQGVKAGVVTDLSRVEGCIRQAVDAAERAADVTVDSLYVNLTAGRLKSQTLNATVNLGGHEVEDADIRKVLGAGAKQAMRVERDVMHSLAYGFSLDAERGIKDPRGMMGDVLGVDVHVLTGDAAPMRNLELAVNRAHLSVERVVATPYASGLSALVDDELEMGAACIDMGGGSTTLSVFTEGRLIHADAIALGGQTVTMDLARGLSTRLEDAERLKVMHGSVLPETDDQHMVGVQLMGEEYANPLQVPRAAMTRIIRARVEEVLELMRDRLAKSGLANQAGRRIVITGGASQLAGMSEAARRIFGRHVRLGRPLGVSGLPDTAKGPAFSTAVGLLIYPQMAAFENLQEGSSLSDRLTGTGGRFQRVSQWLKDSL